MFRKIFSLFVSLFMTIAIGSTPMPEVTGMAVPYDGSFKPVIRFVVSSDSHVNEFADKGCVRIMKMLETGYNAAQADPEYSKLDAAVLVGDITDSGKPTAFASIKACVDNTLRDGTDFMCVVAKSHDSYKGRISRSYASQISGDSADFHKIINGYHFIGISASPTSLKHYTKKQLKWLDAELAKAVADKPEQPVFVFQHENITNTVYGSYTEDGWGVEFFTEILSKYPQAVDFSGHSHYPANDPRSIWQGAFTAINDGGLNYYEFTIDGQNVQHPESSSNMAHMLLVEVDAANRVRVRVCDLNAEAVMTEYMIDNITEPVKTKYAHDTRRANATAPVLTSAPEVSVNGSDAAITVKPATAGKDDVVFIYRVNVTNSKGEVVSSQKSLGDYYKNSIPQDIRFTVGSLNAGNYTVSVVAESAWGPQSQPVTTSFTVK